VKISWQWRASLQRSESKKKSAISYCSIGTIIIWDSQWSNKKWQLTVLLSECWCKAHHCYEQAPQWWVLQCCPAIKKDLLPFLIVSLAVWDDDNPNGAIRNGSCFFLLSEHWSKAHHCGDCAFGDSITMNKSWLEHISMQCQHFIGFPALSMVVGITGTVVGIVQDGSGNCTAKW